MPYVFVRRFLLALSVASLVACGGSDEPAAEEQFPDPDTEPKLSDIQAKIITPRCATAGCHDGTSKDNTVDMRTGNTFKAVVNIGSEEVGGALLVKPNDPDNSLLYRLLSGPVGSAAQMPKTSKLGPKGQEAIRLWIANGAQND